MKSKNNPTARKDNIVVQKLENETLIYDLNANKAFCLNETSVLVWELCDGQTSVRDIASKIGSKMKAPISEDFVCLALDQFQKDSLLENRITNYFIGLTRREVIKSVGFASIVAIPTVTSLVAPKALMAQSCGAIFATCSTANPATCCSGNCVEFGFPASCCEPGVSTNRPGGLAASCIPVGGAATQANCNSAATLACCSGAGTIAATDGTDGCPVNTVACVCNP